MVYGSFFCIAQGVAQGVLKETLRARVVLKGVLKDLERKIQKWHHDVIVEKNHKNVNFQNRADLGSYLGR